MRLRLPRPVAPFASLAVLALVALTAVVGCSPAGTEAPAPVSTAAAESPTTSAPAAPSPSATTDDRVVVTGVDDTFRLVLPPRWKVAPGPGELDKVTVSPGGVLEADEERDQRNAVGYGAGALVIAVRPAKSGGEPNVNIGNRPAGGITDVEQLVEQSKRAIESAGIEGVRSRTTTVGGDPAAEVSGRLEQSGTELTFTQYYVIKDELVWIATVTELDEDSTVAPQIVAGLDFSL